jgi:DNA-binding FrmR family transcriptional regulator
MRADAQSVERLLKTARGQIDGLLKMVEEDRYCMDVYNQLLATQAILNKASKIVLRAHIEGCVKDSFESGDAQQSIDELMSVIDKLSK